MLLKDMTKICQISLDAQLASKGIIKKRVYKPFIMDAMKVGLRKYFNTCQIKLRKTLTQNCKIRIRMLKPKNEQIILKKRHRTKV